MHPTGSHSAMHQTDSVQIVILAGGVGGSRFIGGACTAFPDADITVVGNTGDDITLHGLRICPDLDTVMYTLGGGTTRPAAGAGPTSPGG